MRLDLYTKVILTVIACCLLYLCFVGRTETVHAQAQQHVWIDGASPGTYVPVIIAGVSDVHSFSVPVEIRSASQKVPVSVMNIAGHDLSTTGPVIPVGNAVRDDGVIIPLVVEQR